MLHNSLKTIEAAVCAVAGISRAEIRSATRARRIARPRQAVFFLARERGRMTLPQLGLAYGKDHSTVLHGVRKIAALIEAGDPIAGQLDQARRYLDDQAGERRALDLLAAAKLEGRRRQAARAARLAASWGGAHVAA